MTGMKTARGWLEKRWLGLALVFALGVLLRYVQLAEVPRGYFHDEAWSDVKAWSIVSGAAPPPVYFAENNGMDALHVYAIALVYALTGPLAIGSRLVSALAGSLTILATYWAAWEMLAEERSRHRLALVAAFVVATMFPALAISRSGWHAASIALSITLSLAALFRARRASQRRWWIIGGALAGLAQYAYPTARVLPLLILWIAGIDFFTRRASRRSLIANYCLLFFAAAVVSLPLSLYFLRNPDWLFVRAGQTMDAPLGENLLKTLAGLSLSGDTEGLHNLPSRPVLDPILSLFFIVGIVVGAARHRSSDLVLFGWLIVFTLPVLLTGQAPLTRRWTGVWAAEAIIIAIGATTLAHRLNRRAASAGAVVVPIALVASAIWSAADYFGPYAASPYMFWAYDSGMTQIADYIATRRDATIFLTPYDRFYEVVDITLQEARRAPIQSYNGAFCAVFPEVTTRETEWVVVTEKDERTLPLLRELYPAGQVVWQIDSPVGSYARAFGVPARQTAQLRLTHRAQATLGDKVQLVGYNLSSSIAPGETLRVTLALRNLAQLEQLHKIFVHVKSEDDTVVAQVDRAPCDFTLNEGDWRPGDIVLEAYPITIPPDTRPETYRVWLGVYQAESGVRLPVRDSKLDHTSDAVLLGIVEVRP